MQIACKRAAAELALTLLVTWVLADNANDALSANNFALVTDFLYRRSNFHHFLQLSALHIVARHSSCF
jgi:hypothetical protein